MPRLHVRVLVLVLCICNFQQRIKCLIEAPQVTYEALYRAGMDFYRKKNWSNCVDFIHKSLEDYNFYKENLVKCRLDCKDKLAKSRGSTTELTDISLKKSDFLTLTFFEYLIYESNCVKRCHKRVFGERPVPEDRRVLNVVERDFENGRPYHFLQFCYYQEEEMAKAASAAYTYFLLNPENEDTIANLQLYRGKMGVEDEDITDLARKPYQSLHIEGDRAYGEENWVVAIEKLEGALQEYYKEERACRAECEGLFDQGVKLPDFVHALSEHFISVLQCQNGCEDKLSRIFVDHEEKFVAEHYSYLQFAYYSTNNIDKAIEAAATYLMFNPTDPDMLRNKIYYMSHLGYHDAHFVPREDAKEYYSRRQAMSRILDYVERVYRNNSTDDLDLVNFESIEDSLDEKSHYMSPYERLGIKLKADRDVLKGPRYIADGFLREEQCEELVHLINEVDPYEPGLRLLDIPAITQLVKEDGDREISLRLFLRATEIARHYTARFFNETRLFIQDTKLLCLQPERIDGVESGCVLQENGACIVTEIPNPVSENINEKNYRAVMYLTDHVNKDGMKFKNLEKDTEGVVYPACGRMVGFTAADDHRVDTVSSQRCSLVLNFTTERNHESLDQRRAVSFLNKLSEGRISPSDVNNTQFFKEAARQGIEISMNGSLLQGEDRFVADGLLATEECNTLIHLARAGAVMGDGYSRGSSPHTEHETFMGLSVGRAMQSGGTAGDGYSDKDEYKGTQSPHTKYEIFEGLSVSRASKLAHLGSVSRRWVELYLSASEKGRLLVEKYFNLTRPLYFDYTHLVCRKAVEGIQVNRTDLSHPVHADNCLLKNDGSCIREFPAYTHRDFSAILYLNDQTEFNGGEFFFADRNVSEQTSVKPKCGRLVGFDSGEYHGVKAITKGMRCAVALWFTMDPNHREIAHIQAKHVLQKLSSGDQRERTSHDKDPDGHTETENVDRQRSQERKLTQEVDAEANSRTGDDSEIKSGEEKEVINSDETLQPDLDILKKEMEQLENIKPESPVGGDGSDERAFSIDNENSDEEKGEGESRADKPEDDTHEEL